MDTAILVIVFSGLAFLFGIALGRALEYGDTKEWMNLANEIENELVSYRKELWFYRISANDD